MLSRLACTLLLPAALSACDDGGRPVATFKAGDSATPPDDGADVPTPTRCAESVNKQDFDRDGFGPATGDCDDCDPEIGPAAMDVPNDGIDQDCKDGDARAEPAACDGDLDLDPDDDRAPDAEDAARALGMCAILPTGSRLPGLLDARWLRLSGATQLADARQVGLPARFGDGVVPREGARMLVLSTGVARDAHHDDYTEGCDVFGGAHDDLTNTWPGGVSMPPTFPRASSQCEDLRVDAGARAYDDVGLELTLHAPANAKSLSFDSILFTSSYPDFMCAPASDGFVALLEGAPRRYVGGDVLIDLHDDAIGVDSSLLTVCKRARRGEREVDCGDATLLEGTGFAQGEASCAPLPMGEDDVGGASTGWLRTTVPVDAGSRFTLRFHLWDGGDPLVDTTVAIDNLRFLTSAVDDRAAATVRP